jgi:hypothetical protein
MVQYKKILDRIDNDTKIEKFTIEKCEMIVNEIINNNTNLKGGKPFRQFIRNLFRRDVDGQDIDLVYSFVFVVFLTTILSYVSRDAAKIGQLGFFFIPAFVHLLRARRMRNIPEREFNVLYELTFRNSNRHLQRAPVISFNQYARYYIDGLDLLQWMPTFGNQMITRDFQRDNLRRISSELNLYHSLVVNYGWIALANDDSVDLDLELAIQANTIQLRNGVIPGQNIEPMEHIDYLIIRHASQMTNNRPSENSCNICFEDLIQSNNENETKNENGYLVRLHQQIDSAPHVFHFKCIKNWFRQPNSSSCPVCREDINWGRELSVRNIPENEDGIDFFDVADE